MLHISTRQPITWRNIQSMELHKKFLWQGNGPRFDCEVRKCAYVKLIDGDGDWYVYPLEDMPYQHQIRATVLNDYGSNLSPYSPLTDFFQELGIEGIVKIVIGIDFIAGYTGEKGNKYWIGPFATESYARDTIKAYLDRV